MSDLTVKRWRKGPQDRLYIATRSGIDIGWVDLKSPRHWWNYPGMGTEALAAVARWKADNPGWSRTPAPASRPNRRTSARSAPPVADLADNRAGASLDAIAEQRQIKSRGLRIAARVLGVRTADRSWRVGAAGERRIGRRLERLRRRGWRVLHSVDLGGRGDVDHLLIGPAGIWTVNSKRHPRAVVRVEQNAVTVRKRGRRAYRQPYIDKARTEARRVSAALAAATGRQLNTTPLVVVTGAARVRGWLRRRPAGVMVLPAWAVYWWLRLGGRPILTPAEIDRLHTIARHPDTWTNA